MSFFGMGLAGKALQAFQDAENVTSDNIANISTPGASRQIAVINEAPPIVGSPFFAANSGQVGTFGDGSILQSIQRIHDDSYDTLFRSASSSSNYYSTQQTVLQGVQASFGEPTAGISAAFSDYQASLHALAANPTGTAERTGVIAAASELVGRISSTGQSILNSQAAVLQQAGTIVNQANNEIDQIASLNLAIRAAKAVGDNPNTYQDQRDKLVDDLSTLLGTQSALQANGSTYVSVGGRALVDDGVAYHLAPPVVGTYPTGNAQAGVSRLVIGFANDPQPSNPTGIVLGSGQLQAYTDTYNNKLAVYGRKLDDFANALAWETAKVTNAGYDLNGVGGVALFQPIVQQRAISATNIRVGISDPAQFPAGVASTAAGTLITALNSGNNTVLSSAQLSDPTFNNPAPAAAVGAVPPYGGLQGYLTVNVDGVNEYFYYDTSGRQGLTKGPDHTGAPGSVYYSDTSTVGNFVNSFNAQHFGVDASFDSSSQRIVFTRDPANIDLTHRAAQVQGTGATQIVNSATPDFTITDSLNPATAAGPPPVAAAAPAPGTTAVSLLQTLGASQINGIDQSSANAWGTNNAGAVNALLQQYASGVGDPGLQLTLTQQLVVGQNTVTEPLSGGFARINVGDTLTLDATRPDPTQVNPPPYPKPQEDVVVTAVDRNTGTITFTTKYAHGSGAGAPYSLTSAQSNTLGQSYANVVSLVGLDASTAIKGTSTQTNLANNIDKVRQGVDGINLDEETQNLIKFQNAYAAAAHVIAVLDQLLQTAVKIGS